MRNNDRKRHVAVAVVAALLTLWAVPSASPTGAADPVIVFYTICDKTPAASGPTDTVKVKRVNEDGTGAVTIGDTGIAHCSNAMPTTFHSGFAVAGEYGYFAWFDSDGTSAGVGRIKLDGTAPAQKNFITAPAGTKWLQMSPTSVGGYLYAYIDNGQSGFTTLQSRIARVSTSGGSFSTVISPVATDANADSFSFGVGKDALYFSTNSFASKRLEKVGLDGSNRNSTFFDLADPANDPTNTVQFLTGRGANLVAESDSKLFLYDQTAGTGDTGISTITAASPVGTRQAFAAVPAASGNPPANSIVWGGNYLYFKDFDGVKIGRTTATAAGLNTNVFPSLMTGGFVHHISPAKASTVTVDTTTTSTAAPTTTSAPTTTVAATTTVPAAAPVVSRSGLSSSRVAAHAKLSVPKGAKVTLSVASSSRKTCSVKGSKLVSLKAGTCRVTVTVSPKKGAKKKATVSLKTS